MSEYGTEPVFIGDYNINLTELMHYQYLPVCMFDKSASLRLPPNLEVCKSLVIAALSNMLDIGKEYRYVYLTARKGWASPDNPLNRPGWHTDGFGTDDMNYIWWTGPGTRFAIQKFNNISEDHIVSAEQFEQQVDENKVQGRISKQLYALDPFCVHATPKMSGGCMRQFIKISLSNNQYNLADNSHNYLFDYNWDMVPRDVIRNDPHKAQHDFAEIKSSKDFIQQVKLWKPFFR